MDRLFFGIGALMGLLAVAAGAFAAHGLKHDIPPDMIAIFETGARYQMYHALALLAAAWAWTRWGGGLVRCAGWFFIAGIAIFSGSLYILALTGARAWGAVTPIGGVAFLAGWLMLALAAWRGR
jgi:uncharacterized membrane protein YgdD (TMEM256/DUF423 family)